MASFEMDRYRLPSGTLPAMLAVSRSLIAAGDKTAGPQVKKALKKVHAAAVAAQAAWKLTDGGGVDVRAADNVIDNAHAALEIHLQSYAWLPTELPSDDVDEAERLHELLYGQGLTFLKLPYAEEWAESEQRLLRIQEQNLRPSLERLAGKVFVDALFSAHAKYGVALGITKADTTPAASGIGNELKALVASINQYVRVVAGTVDDDDDGTVVAAVAMLRPVELYRTRTLAGRSTSNGADAPADGGDAPAPRSPDPSGKSPTQPEAPSAPIPPVQ